MGSDDYAGILIYASPHDNTCGECKHEWRSLGTPAECPVCSASMPENGVCFDVRDEDRPIDVKPVGEDPITDIHRRMKQMRESDAGLRDIGMTRWAEEADKITGREVDDTFPPERDSSSSPHERYHRGPYWEKQRSRAIERDNERCQICGISREDYLERFNRSLPVHHIRPERKYDAHKEAHKINNLITVCCRCHRTVEGDSRSRIRKRAEHDDWDVYDL